MQSASIATNIRSKLQSLISIWVYLESHYGTMVRIRTDLYTTMECEVGKYTCDDGIKRARLKCRWMYWRVIQACVG